MLHAELLKKRHIAVHDVADFVVTPTLEQDQVFLCQIRRQRRQVRDLTVGARSDIRTNHELDLGVSCQNTKEGNPTVLELFRGTLQLTHDQTPFRIA
ncbi:hypothetical protein D3C81_1225370 [compost metagenome]